MDHTCLVTALDLALYADRRECQADLPELLRCLLQESVPDITRCRIPSGDAINQPGWDGYLETAAGFKHFVPLGNSYWELGAGGDFLGKATSDFKVRTAALSPIQRQNSAFVFVTPRTWDDTSQARWKKGRAKQWKELRIIDGVILEDWIRHYPAIGRWLLQRMGHLRRATGFVTCREHWEELQSIHAPEDPALPAKLFLTGRGEAAAAVHQLIRGETFQVLLQAESPRDVEDFVAAFLAQAPAEERAELRGRVLFIREADAWESLMRLSVPHAFIADPGLDIGHDGQHLLRTARANGHKIVIPVLGSAVAHASQILPLRSPGASAIETVLKDAGYSEMRARELASRGALSLAALLRHLLDVGDVPPYTNWASARLLAEAGLLGKWSGDNAPDVAIVETIVGKSYGEWIAAVRPETLRPDTPLMRRTEHWFIVPREEAWMALGPTLSNQHIARFRACACTVLGELDPRLELPQEQRWAASMHGKMLQHSEALRRGMAETLALLGCRSEALTSCIRAEREAAASLTVRQLLRDVDWNRWASLERLLPLLAEAAPDEFLGSLEAALVDPASSPFKEVFAQEHSGVGGWNYLSGLLWALEVLAWHADYLPRVVLALGELAAMDPGGTWANRPANTLVQILLPWLPQTCAGRQQRQQAVQALLREQPAVGWTLLMSLLPQHHGITMYSRRPIWRRLIAQDWSPQVRLKDYWGDVAAYTELALEMAADNLDRIGELASRIPDLPEPAHIRILDWLSAPDIRQLAELERLPLWEALVDLAVKHRRHPDAQWAMPSGVVDRLEAAAAALAPRDPTLLHRRLFSARAFDLLEANSNFREYERELGSRRQRAVAEIVNGNRIEDVFAFAEHVDLPHEVGRALGSLDEITDALLLPGQLGSVSKKLAALVAGFALGRYLRSGWAWADHVVEESWSAHQIAQLFTLLPFGPETWSRVEQRSGDVAAEYWRTVPANPWGSVEGLHAGVEQLLAHQRPRAALTCLYRLRHEKAAVSPELVIRALREGVSSSEQPTALDQHLLRDLILWLQEQRSIDQQALFHIEWIYLPLLDEMSQVRPRTLERRLATDPEFFCDILTRIFRSEQEPETKPEITESERRVAENAYRMLQVWRQVPGVTDEGFDRAAFDTWLMRVLELASNSGHLKVAMTQIGQMLVHAPPDPNGLWLHEGIAAALDKKDAERMRRGFTIGLYNKRGSWCGTAGKEERAIAERYREQAGAVAAKGYHRLATAVRNLAAQYEEEAAREAEADDFDFSN